MPEEVPAASDVPKEAPGAAGAAGGVDVATAAEQEATTAAYCPLTTTDGRTSTADGDATGAVSAEAPVKDKVATEAAAAADRGFGEGEEAALKGLSHKERLRMLVPVHDPADDEDRSCPIEFATESSKLLLYGKEVRCCCVF